MDIELQLQLKAYKYSYMPNILLKKHYRRVENVSEATKKRGWIGPLILAIICVILLWPIAFFGSDWTVYWGHWLLSVIFALALAWLRTKYFWEE